MKYYNYSVQEVLMQHFGEKTIYEMRRPHNSAFKNEEDKNLVPLLWQYADEMAVQRFLDERFLLETIVKDDYIVYLAQFNENRQAYLMFMTNEQEPFFRMDASYAGEIMEPWIRKGYEVFILRECVGVEYYGRDSKNGFHLVQHSREGHGSALYELRNVNGQPMLVFSSHPCWEEYYRKLLFLSGTDDVKEYECLFEPDVQLTIDEQNEKNVLESGLPAVYRLLHSGTVSIVYREFADTETYSQCVLADGKELWISVDRCNLICEIKLVKAGEHLIYDTADNASCSLLDAIPSISGIRALDSKQIHGYAIQLSYADDTVRNYYLCSFPEQDVPETCMVSGFRFADPVLRSASVGSDGSICFCNGYRIPRHIAFYRSYRQVQIQKTGNILGEANGIAVRSVYRLPLLEFKKHFSARQYRGFKGECFGPKLPWIDKEGNRVSDIALFSSDGGYDNTGISCVCVEPTGKYGYLKEDGSWFCPPVFDKAARFAGGYAKASRIADGKEIKYMVTETGQVISFPYPFGPDNYSHDRVVFNAKEWEGQRPDPGYYYDFDEVKPGLWGIADTNGKVIVEPKYVYAVGFWNTDGNHCVVARFVEGELLWGVINHDGIETIPCLYPGLYCRWGEAVAFQRKKDGPFGLMDFNGYVILEPRFGYIDAYDSEHGLVTAGEDSDHLGAFSIELGKMITPEEFDCIDYDDHMISAEIAWTCKDRYFDYHGNELYFDGFDEAFEADGLLYVRKDGKVGVLAWDRTVIIPPVLEDGLEKTVAYYQRGYLVTGTRKTNGLSRANGEVILPQIYSNIELVGDLAVASEQTDSNWCIRDSVFTLEGVPVLEGALRNIRISEKEKRLTVETPCGIEYCEIVFDAGCVVGDERKTKKEG